MYIFKWIRGIKIYITCIWIKLTLQCQGLPASRTGHPSEKCSWPSSLGVESSGHGGTVTNKDKLILHDQSLNNWRN